jgi:molybdopterin-guanine dinucleotide biosynthesis protein A
MNRIFILSEPIQTGKTTLLKHWATMQPNIAGILTPDVDHKRKLYDLNKHVYYDLQLNSTDKGLSIGRFIFDESVFMQAQQILKEAQYGNHEWVVVDEIGRLEMESKKGLEPYVTDLIAYYKNENTSGNLLLVIRDYLLEAAVKHYQLQDAIVLPKHFFDSPNMSYHHNHALTGIVLCGGQSVRMGKDKAFIVYHQKPQYAHVADQLASFCQQVFISCNEQQKNSFNKDYKHIKDSATYSSSGPITGVLSAFENIQQSGLLVIGCDYPHLTLPDILTLVENRNKEHDVVCYHNPESGFDEPLLAIYEKQCAPILQHYHQSGQTSLRHFLSTVRTKRLLPVNNGRITSIDN